MVSLNLAHAHAIVDRISEMFSTGELNLLDTDFPCEKVGVSSRAEAMAALFLETAYNYKQAVLQGVGDGKLFSDYANAAGVISMTISVGKKNEPAKSYESEVLDDFKNLETISSFVAFLKKLDAEAADYWHLVFSRVKLQLPRVDIALDLNLVEKHPIRDSFLRIILTLLWYGVAMILAVALQGGAVFLAYSTIKPVVDAMGGSALVQGLGWVVGFAMVIVIILAVVTPVTWVMHVVEKRWPDNPVRRLIAWVKEWPTKESSYSSDY